MGGRAEVAAGRYDARDTLVWTVGALSARRRGAACRDGPNPTDVPVASGVYVYEIQAGDAVVKGKMLLAK